MNVMIPPTETKKLNSLIKDGYFKSKNEAVQRAVDLLAFDIKQSSKLREEIANSIKETRGKMWKECLNEADNDENRAWDVFYEKYCK